jgi:hypothetical protein
LASATAQLSNRRHCPSRRRRRRVDDADRGVVVDRYDGQSSMAAHFSALAMVLLGSIGGRGEVDREVDDAERGRRRWAAASP